MHDRITGVQFRDMLLFGAALVTQNKQSINDLNVFPVPDGDTGTNMSLTIETAAAELASLGAVSVEKAASVAASAMLRGARGNSGVILSLLFRGIAKGLKGCAEADGCTFAAALQEGVSTAYSAVMKPAEGTILTVSRLAADRAMQAANEKNSVEYALEKGLACGEDTLRQTTVMNPVLKKAGVVDAGGKGFLFIWQGMLASLRGEEMPQCELPAAAKEKADFSLLAQEALTYTYDTVFIVRKTGRKAPAALRAYLGSVGDSLVIGEDDEVFKVHVHTDIPGEVLAEAQKYGTLELAKIENMRSQRDDLAAGRTPACTDDLEECESAQEPRKPYGFLSVCSGDGLSAVFTDLGADGIISGGQTMNPSTESILNEIRRVNAETVFVLPNNKNIIMAAQQCVALTDQNVIVIPSASVPQGISAMMAVDPDAPDAQTIADSMNAALASVTTAQITYAARSSEFDGFTIREGDYLALLEGKLLGTESGIEPLLTRLAHEAAEKGASLVSLFYGEDVSAEDAQKAAALFTELCPDAEVNLLSGGQPVYYYIISIE